MEKNDKITRDSFRRRRRRRGWCGWRRSRSGWSSSRRWGWSRRRSGRCGSFRRVGLRGVSFRCIGLRGFRFGSIRFCRGGSSRGRRWRHRDGRGRRRARIRRGRCGRRGFRDRSRLRRQITKEFLARSALLTRGEDRQREGQHKKHHREADGELLQHVSRLRAPHLTGHGVAERSAEPLLPRTLHEDDEDEEEADDDFDYRENADQHKGGGGKGRRIWGRFPAWQAAFRPSKSPFWQSLWPL